MNSKGSLIAPGKRALNCFTSWFADASTGFGPSSFFLTGALGAPAAGGAAFSASDSFTAATRDFACSTIADFSASAPANSPPAGIAEGGGVPCDSGGVTTPGTFLTASSAALLSGLSLSSTIGFWYRAHTCHCHCDRFPDRVQTSAEVLM